MRTSSFPFWAATGLTAFLLASCAGGGPEEKPEDEATESATQSVSSEAVPREEVTRNVTHRGVIAKAGISIYMQGTHRLQLSDGRFLLLESADLDLDTYVGDEAEVTGDVRPTVEADGLIMDVRNIARVLRPEATEAESSAALPTEERSSSSAAPSAESASSASSASTPSSVATVSSVPPVEEPPPPPAVDLSAAFQARATLMASHSTEASQWTQQYCTSHIGFCIPVHRNWWFKSFGANTKTLWHVELSSEEVATLGDGPIIVNLVSGSLSGASDGEVSGKGEFVVGYRAWTENRHFEISGPNVLVSAVTYITKNLRTYEAP